jgi:glycerol uptake facilitator-like aquaporin
MNELAGSVSQLIQQVTVGFQKMSPEAWRVAVYQAKISGYQSIFGWNVLAFCLFVLIIKLLKVRKEDPSEDKTITIWILSIVTICISTVSIGYNLDKIINPEYTAASNIVEMFKPTTVCSK